MWFWPDQSDELLRIGYVQINELVRVKLNMSQDTQLGKQGGTGEYMGLGLGLGLGAGEHMGRISDLPNVICMGMWICRFFCGGHSALFIRDKMLTDFMYTSPDDALSLRTCIYAGLVIDYSVEDKKHKVHFQVRRRCPPLNPTCIFFTYNTSSDKKESHMYIFLAGWSG